MKARWRILIGCGLFFVLLVGGLLLTGHFGAKHALDAYKKVLRDKGERLDIAELLSPPVPPESNSVESVKLAFSKFNFGNDNVPDAMKMVAPGKALICARQPMARGYDFTNTWEEFGADVSSNRLALELLREVLDRPVLDFQSDCTQNITLTFSYLVPIKRSALELDAAAIVGLHNGDTGAATTNILILLALVQKNASDGLLISHLVRMALAAIAVNPTWELLQATNVTDAQLAMLQNGWEQMEFIRDATNAFAVERAWSINEIEKERSSHQGFNNTFGTFLTTFTAPGSSVSGWDLLTARPRYVIGEWMWRSSWSYSEELQTIETESLVLETLRAMQTNQSRFYKADYDAMKTRLPSLETTNKVQAIFRVLQIPDFSGIFGNEGIGNCAHKVVQFETTRAVVVTAIALKRYQLQHGTWPQNLDELLPAYLSEVPIDPMSGKPLRYHPNTDGTYLLYSVGENGKDDGGNATLEPGAKSSSLYWLNLHTLDWVWPQPATEAEIKDYYERPKK